MRTVSIISQKGGAGKTTLAIHLAVAAHQAKEVVVLFDADPQATASQWAEWRGDQGLEEPAVIDCAAPGLLAKKLRGAAEAGATVAVIDTPPHADIMAREACKIADLVIIPCRPQAFDLAAVQTTAELVRSSGKRAYVVFVGGPIKASNIYREAQEHIESHIGVPVAPVVLPNRAVFHHSTGIGRAAVETNPVGAGAEEVRGLWAWIAAQCAEVEQERGGTN